MASAQCRWYVRLTKMRTSPLTAARSVVFLAVVGRVLVGGDFGVGFEGRDAGDWRGGREGCSLAFADTGTDTGSGSGSGTGSGTSATSNASASSTASASSSVSAPAAPPYSYHRDAKDPRWVQGEVTLNAPPDVVFALVEKVDSWPQTLTDIKRFKVTSHHGDHWQVDLETRTIPAGMLGYDVEVMRPVRELKLYTDRMGVKAVAQTNVRPAPIAGQSILTYSLYLTASGVASMLISNSSLRSKQEHMVAVSLADFYRTFPPSKAQ